MPDPSVIGEEVTTLSKSIVEYGAFSVILAFAMVLIVSIVFYTMNNSKKQDSKLLQEMHDQAEQDRLLMNELLKALIPSTKMSEPEEQIKKDIVKNYIEINNVFGSISKDTLSKVSADRVGVYVFHNGNYSAHGLPFFKMSCVGEWIVRGSGVLRGKNHIDLPLHIFSDIIEKIYDRGEYYNDTTASSVGLILKDFLQNTKINFVYILAIYDKSKNLAGFIIAEFKCIQDQLNIDTIIKPAIKDMANSISEIIVNANIKDKLKE